MGNLSSCSTAAPATLKSSALVTTVLLIDGSMLKFPSPIKVIHLLLDYPHHVVCPLDSLKPGLHSLSSLLPDEKLQLGRLYLLLPFKTHMQQRSSSCTAKSKPAMRHLEGKRLQETERKHSQMSIREMEKCARLPPRDKKNVGFVDRGKPDVGFGKHDRLSGNGGVRRDRDYKPLHSSSLTREEQVTEEKELGRKGICEIAQRREKQGFMGRADMGADLDGYSADLRQYVGRRSAASYGKLYTKRRGKESIDRGNAGLIPSKCEHVIISPLCDTPELQRAYRSFLRRSSSWTPRLQPIIERR